MKSQYIKMQTIQQIIDEMKKVFEELGEEAATFEFEIELRQAESDDFWDELKWALRKAGIRFYPEHSEKYECNKGSFVYYYGEIYCGDIK